MDDPRASLILDIVAKETFIERDRLTPDATIDSLGIASIDIVQAMFALETQFNIEIPVAGQGGGNEFSTVKELLDHVLSVLGPAPA